jgi:hypothetical protein
VKDYPNSILLALYSEIFMELITRRGFAPNELTVLAFRSQPPATALRRVPQFQILCLDTLPEATACLYRAERFGVPLSPGGILDLSLGEIMRGVTGEPKIDTALACDDAKPELYDTDEYEDRPRMTEAEKAQLRKKLDAELDGIAVGRVDFDPNTPEGIEMLLLGWKPLRETPPAPPSPPSPPLAPARAWKSPNRPLRRPEVTPAPATPTTALTTSSTVTITMSPTGAVTVTVASPPS